MCCVDLWALTDLHKIPWPNLGFAKIWSSYLHDIECQRWWISSPNFSLILLHPKQYLHFVSSSSVDGKRSNPYFVWLWIFFLFGYCISVLIAVHFTFNLDDLTQEWFVLFEFYFSIIWPSQSATASSFLLLGFVHFRHSRHEALWLWSNRDFLAAARSIKV